MAKNRMNRGRFDRLSVFFGESAGTSPALVREWFGDSPKPFEVQRIARRAAPKRGRSGVEADPKRGRSGVEADPKRGRTSPEAVPKRTRTPPEDHSKTTRRPLEASDTHKQPCGASTASVAVAAGIRRASGRSGVSPGDYARCSIRSITCNPNI